MRAPPFARLFAWLLALGCLGAAVGCASRPVAAKRPSAWPAALAQAEQYAGANQFAQADSVLEAFAAAHPGAADTLDILLRRAVYRADPANTTDGALAEAVALLDRYLSAPEPQPRRYEAQAIRRLAEIRSVPPVVKVDTVRTVDSSAVRAAVTREVEALTRARDEEAQLLRDSLTRATAELERIRRRLAPQRP